VRRGAGAEALEGAYPAKIQPGPHGGDPPEVQAIDPASALGRLGHEAGRLEDTKLLRHPRPADWQCRCKLAHSGRMIGEAFKDEPPRRIAERAKGVMAMIGR
jgi:hypothetical protein